MPKLVQLLIQQHRAGKFNFSNWVLEQEDNFWEQVIFYDEKLKVNQNINQQVYLEPP